MFKFMFIVLCVAVGFGAAYHYYPRETTRTAHKAWDKATRVTKEITVNLPLALNGCTW